MVTSVGRRSNIYKKTINRSEVSRAWCPAHVECCVAVGKPAQFRRAILLKSQVFRKTLSEKRLHLSDLFITLGRKLRMQTRSNEQSLYKRGTLELPVTPRVRILETIDLSSSDIEHFLGEDAIVPVTPKLSAFLPLPEMKSSPHDTIIA